MTDPRALLPSVSVVLDDIGHDPRIRAALVAVVARDALADLRGDLPADITRRECREQAVAATRARIDALVARPRRTINATGVVLHTGLGRAPLSAAARAAVVDAAGPWAVEVDADGRRGHRDRRLADLVRLLTGAQDVTFANNGAGALLLALRATAGGGRVAVSRGELVEIGGSFRLPDVVAAAGVTLHEVGTTNRTHLADVRAALADGVDAVLVVHPSNYRVEGFTHRPALADVATACHGAGVPLVLDAGSGLLEASDLPAMVDERAMATGLADGADLVTGSGDKVLGGPQAGIVAGRTDLVGAARRDPLARALRLDKLRVAALVATLQDHVADPAGVPVRRLLAMDPADLRARGEAVRDRLAERGVPTEVVEVTAVVGGGASPGETLESTALAVDVAWADHLRAGSPSVATRVRDGRCLVDLRAVDPDDDHLVAAALLAVHREIGGHGEDEAAARDSVPTRPAAAT